MLSQFTKFTNENYHRFLLDLTHQRKTKLEELVFKVCKENDISKVNELLEEFLTSPDYEGLNKTYPSLQECILFSKENQIKDMGVPPSIQEGNQALKKYLDDLKDKENIFKMLRMLQIMNIQVIVTNECIPLSVDTAEDMEECEMDCDAVIGALIETLEAHPQSMEVIRTTVELIGARCPITLEIMQEILDTNEDHDPDIQDINQQEIDDQMQSIDDQIGDLQTPDNYQQIRDEMGDIKPDLEDLLDITQKQDLDKAMQDFLNKITPSLMHNHTEQCKSKLQKLKSKWLSLIMQVERKTTPPSLDFSSISKFFKCIIK